MQTPVLAGTSAEFILQTQNGCDSVVVVTAIEVPAVDFSVILEKSCPNSPTGTAEFLNITGTAPFEFSSDGGFNFQNDPIFENLSAGVKNFVVRDQNDCLHEISDEIPAIPALEVQLFDQFLTCDTLEITLLPTVSGADTSTKFLWKNASGAVVGNEISLFVDAENQYFFSATNACQTDSAQISVAFDPTSIGSMIYLPNAFAPESDGNAEWKPYFSNDVQLVDYQLIIMDRWGNLVFKSDDSQTGWNGIYRDKKLLPGVFVFYLEADAEVCRQPTKIKKKGDLTLIR
jgi:gliding motility-associated-like protein